LPKIVDHEQFRKEILEKAHAVFRHEGYQAISLRKLSSELGVTTGTLYHYFKNKEDLVRAVLENALNESIGGSKGSIFTPRPSSKSFPKHLEDMFKIIEGSEDNSLTDILLLTDFFRDKSSRISKKEDSLIALRYLDAFTQALNLPEKNKAEARFVLAYIVGVHLVRLWSGKKAPLSEYARLLQEKIK